MSFPMGLSLAGGTTSLLTGLTSSYRSTTANTITLIIRRTGLRSDIVTSGNYQEYIASLTVSHHL